MNIDLSQVLFASPAVGGKLDKIVTNDDNRPMMSAVSNYTGSDWKLTVLDESRSNFDVRCLSFKDGMCKISYSNATGQIDDRISGMIVDADGNVKYYGVLGYANPATTKFAFDVSGQYEVGDRIYIFNEEVHGDKQTDYSSRLIDITPEKLPEGITATVGQTLADVVIPNPEGNTDGTWTWDDPSTPVGTEGEYTFAATFTPEDTSLFDTVHTNLTVTVLPAPAEEAQDWQSVTIDDQISINFLLDKVKHAGMQSITITYTNQEKETKTLNVDVGKLVIDEASGRYRVPAVVAPAQIGDTVTITIAEANGSETKYETSIAEYCRYLMNGDFSDEVKALARATLEYGQAANAYFGYAPAFATTDDAQTAVADAAGLENHMSVVAGGKINSISFMALTKPEFRFYVNPDCGLTEADFVALNNGGKIHVDGNAAAQFVKNTDTGAIMLEVTGVEAKDMDKVITITIDGFVRSRSAAMTLHVCSPNPMPITKPPGRSGYSAQRCISTA